MKGFTNIKLYDKHGNIVKDQDDNNMITNLLNDFLKAILSTKQNKILGKEDNIINQFKNMKLIDFIGGIVLYPDTIPENAEIQGGYIESVASAGSRYDYADPLRGSLNELESGETTVDGKKAYRYVWDFGTSNGNCTFNSLCLTSGASGNRALQWGNNCSEYRSSGFNLGINPSRSGWIVNKKGEHIYLQDNAIKKYDSVTEFTVDQKISSINTIKSHTVPNFPELSGTIYIDENKIILAGKSSMNSKWYMLKLNPETFALEEQTQLGDIDLGTGVGKFFTRVGTDDILYNWRFNGNNPVKYKVYNLKTGIVDDEDYEIPSWNANTSYVNADSWPFAFSTFKAADKYYTSIKGTYSQNTPLWGTFMYDKNTPINCTCTRREYGNPNNRVAPAIMSDITTFTSISNYGYSTHGSYSDYYGHNGCIEYNGIEPLFTINNLDAPVTKTEANTMKITYTLIFD